MQIRVPIRLRPIFMHGRPGHAIVKTTAAFQSLPAVARPACARLDSNIGISPSDI
jgi:hypothetical protein